LRKALFAHGLRYRLNFAVPDMPRRTIDIAFPRARVAVFVDGCFWHMCPSHATWPKSNAGWWRAKLEKNVKRDQETTEHLEALGWSVLRIWEHEDVSEASERIIALVRRSGETEPS
jgi:DNA mismatch endonuclease (patch repair protein)